MSECPTTLASLLALTPAELARCDIARMNLLCAVGLPGAEDLDVEAMLQRLDAWSERIRHVTASHLRSFKKNPWRYDDSEPLWRMVTLALTLQNEFRIRYSPHLRVDDGWDWKDSSDLLIHGLLGERRCGSCPSIPVLLTAIGRRLGYPVRLVKAPAHVFCRWDGLTHSRWKWRKRENIEFHGHGVSNYADEYYETWPVPWSAECYRLQAGPEHLRPFLRSLTPAEELASFLCQRGHCQEAHERLNEAWTTYAQAAHLVPTDPVPKRYAQMVHKKILARDLAPFGMSPEVYHTLLESRKRGSRITFPWEKMIPPPLGNSRLPVPPSPPDSQHLLRHLPGLKLPGNVTITAPFFGRTQ